MVESLPVPDPTLPPLKCPKPIASPYHLSIPSLFIKPTIVIYRFLSSVNIWYNRRKSVANFYASAYLHRDAVSNVEVCEDSNWNPEIHNLYTSLFTVRK